MTEIRRVCRQAGAAGQLMLLVGFAALGSSGALADAPAVLDSQSIVRSLTPSSSPSAGMTRGFTVAARPAAGGAEHKVDLDIRFANNSTQLSESAHSQLAELGAALNSPQLAHTRFLIAGHTNATGAAEYNRKLSESRAQAVRAYLLQQFKIPADRIEATGYGASRPLPQFPPESIQQRRVEITPLPQP
jgi:OOP family OmpA-OmpF porin